MQYIIDLTLYGITQGSFGRPPYTLNQYNIAKANGDGINAAIQYAVDNGYNEIILPRGIYTVCYHYETQNLRTPVIKMLSNIAFDMNGSTIEVMFDSLNRSPFDSSTNKIYALYGSVFMFENCHNSSVKNGIIKGDIYNRAFADGTGIGTEAAQEQTYAVFVSYRSSNIKVANMNMHGFMGDAITGLIRGNDVLTITSGYGNALAGYMRDDGTIQNDAFTAGQYHSPIITIDRAKLASVSPKNPNTLQMNTAGGGVPIKPIGDGLYEVILYNEDGAFSRRINLVFLGLIELKMRETSLRVQYFNAEKGLDVLPTPKMYAFMDIATNMIEVRNCRIHNNHRGGISNLGDFSIIENNLIYNNGLDSGIGAPQFPYGTRYQINIEDVYSKNVIIQNNNFFSGYFGLLIGCDSATVRGNTFSQFTNPATVVYNSQHVVIDDNKFDGCGGMWVNPFMDDRTGYTRNIIFSNNRVAVGGGSHGIFIENTTDNPKVIIKGNYFECSNFMTDGGDRTELIDNTIRINGHAQNYLGVFIRKCGVMRGNSILGNGVNWERCFLNVQRSSNNYFEKLNFYYSYSTVCPRIVVYPEGTYKDCTAATMTVPASQPDLYTMNFSNSTFDNCDMYIPSMITAPETFKSKGYFDRCRFVIDTKIPVRGFAANSIPDIIFKDCNVEYKSTPIVLVQGQGRSSVQQFKIEIGNTIARGIDNFDFGNYITGNGK